jgi:hypothetical protein
MLITTEDFKKLPVHQQLRLIFPKVLCSQIWTETLKPSLSLLFGKPILNPVKLTEAILNYHQEDKNTYILDVILKHYGREKLQFFGICQEIEDIVSDYLSKQSKL